MRLSRVRFPHRFASVTLAAVALTSRAALAAVPVVGPLHDMTVVETDTAVQDVAATDADGDEIVLWKQAGPAFLTVHTAAHSPGWVQGRIEVASPLGSAGSYSCIVRASDTFTFSDASFQLVVTPWALPPVVFHPTPDTTATTHAVTVVPLHADPAELVTFEALRSPFPIDFYASGLAQAALLEPQWTAHVGTWQVILRASAPSYEAAYDTIWVTVTADPRPPIVSASAPSHVLAGLATRVRVLAWDPDLDPLTSLVVDRNDIPAGDALSLQPTTANSEATLYWTPSRPGLFRPRFVVTDGSGASGTCELPVEVVAATARCFLDEGIAGVRLASARARYCFRFEPTLGAFDLGFLALEPLRLELPALSDRSIRAETTGAPPEGDRDRNGTMEGVVCFDRESLRSLFEGAPPGRREWQARIVGRLQDGTVVEAPLRLSVEIPGGVSATLAPNPIRRSGWLSLYLVRAAPAVVTLHDARGRRLRTFHRGLLEAGYHDFPFDGKDGAGRLLASGVYFYRVEAEGIVSTGRLTLLR